MSSLYNGSRAYKGKEVLLRSMISEGSKPVKIFTAVKRKKLRHFRFFGALNFESVETFTSVKFA